uniref:Uncharacterized protein n=1 Tax=Populus trichocarpa TaxID=3694 RepID=A0A2K2A3X4_POPTR
MGCPAKRWIGREGNGAEGRLWLNKIMGFFAFAVLATVAKTQEWFGRNEGMVWFSVYGSSVWFLATILGLLWLGFFAFAVLATVAKTQEWFGQNEGMVWAKRRNGLVFCVWVLCLVSGNNYGFAVAGFFCVCCASNSGENAGMVWAKRRNG